METIKKIYRELLLVALATGLFIWKMSDAKALPEIKKQDVIESLMEGYDRNEFHTDSITVA